MGSEHEPDPFLYDAQHDKARGAFYARDTDNSGVLGKSEMKGLLGDLDLKFDSEMWEKFVEPSWDQVGTDDDGRCDFDEFLLFYARILAPGFVYGPRLRKACGRGEATLVKEFVTRGCNPKGADGSGFTPLHYSAQYDQIESIKELYSMADKKEFDPDPIDRSGWTPLMCACANGKLASAKLLLEYGASTSIANKAGRTALHWAAAKGRDNVIKVLLAGGADANAKDGAGWTSLHCAAMHGHVKTCATLIFEGEADRNAEDMLKNTSAVLQDESFWNRVADETQRCEDAAPKKGKRK